MRMCRKVVRARVEGHAGRRRVEPPRDQREVHRASHGRRVVALVVVPVLARVHLYDPRDSRVALQDSVEERCSQLVPAPNVGETRLSNYEQMAINRASLDSAQRKKLSEAHNLIGSVAGAMRVSVRLYRLQNGSELGAGGWKETGTALETVVCGRVARSAFASTSLAVQAEHTVLSASLSSHMIGLTHVCFLLHVRHTNPRSSSKGRLPIGLRRLGMTEGCGIRGIPAAL